MLTKGRARKEISVDEQIQQYHKILAEYLEKVKEFGHGSDIANLVWDSLNTEWQKLIGYL
jgi:hypothetical protein